MVDINTNWILKQYKSMLHLLKPEQICKIINQELLKGSLQTMLNWDVFNKSYEFNYDSEGNEKEISGWLMNSSLSNYKNIILLYDLQSTPINVPFQLFSDKWEDFVSADGYSGLIVISDDGKLLMEFTDDSQYLLKSNFLIKPDRNHL